MSLTSVELWQRVAAAGLASPMQCRSWAADVAASLSAAENSDGARVLAQLVTQGILTQYQADVLLSGSGVPLIRKGWRVLQQVADPVWKNWIEASKPAQQQTAWLRWLTVEDLQSDALREASPSLPNALRHSQVDAPGLQRVFAPEMVDGTLQLSVLPLDAPSLAATFDGRPIPYETVIAIIKQVAQGLASLHAAGLTHGRVTPDRISLHPRGSAVLMRDPLCSNSLGMNGAVSGSLEALFPPGLQAAHFLAPEFLAPAQPATQSTDCYALGCIWWLLLTGKPHVTGNNMSKIMAAHAEGRLDPSLIRSQPAPLNRVLQHLLAKNISARFADASQLLESLSEAERVTAAGPVKKAAKPKATVAAPVEAKPAPAQLASPEKSESKATAPAKQTEPKPIEKPTTEKLATENTVVEPAAAVAKNVAAKAAQPRATESQPVKSEAIKPEPVKPVPTKSEPVKLDSVKPESVDAKPAAKPTPAAAAAATGKAAPPSGDVPVKAAPTTAKPVKNIESVPAAVASVESTTKRTAPVQSVVKPQPGVTQASAQPQRGITPSVSTAGPVPASMEQDVAGAVSQTASTGTSSTSSSQPSTLKTGSKPAAKKSGKPGAAGAKRGGVKRKQQSNKFMLPLIGGGGVLALLMLVLVLSGALNFTVGDRPEKKPTTGLDSLPPVTSTPTETVVRERDPRSEFFELVSADKKEVLWAPPNSPVSVPIDMLPPGGQLFLSVRPADWMSGTTTKQLLARFDKELAPFWQWLQKHTGSAPEGLAQVTIAGYPGKEGVPRWAIRVKLSAAKPLSELKAAWGNATESKLGDKSLLTTEDDRAYWIAAQPLTDVQSVTEFSVGSVSLMKEVAELDGVAGPLVNQVEQLWRWSDAEADLCLITAPNFLYSEGRELLNQSPPRFATAVQSILNRELRGAMLTTTLDPQWYYEVRLVGASDRDAPTIGQKLSERILGAADDVDKWFVEETPHPYWRALANKYPFMLRALASNSRSGVEGGQAILNGYLPSPAATNLVVASWVGSQEAATIAAVTAGPATTTPAAKPLTGEDILDRKIKVIIDQQGIEVVLQLIGEQAMEGLPAGSAKVRFELDGPAFQRGGITRNQQIRDFKIDNLPVRAALTELAKRGNPEPGITDLTSDGQKLLWLLMDDPSGNGEKILSLTSRDAATEKKLKLPPEFAPKQ
ncbi:MAG: hypothetical protein U0892_18170 [Pirellulales bacterium]